MVEAIAELAILGGGTCCDGLPYPGSRSRNIFSPFSGVLPLNLQGELQQARIE
jgi:hypothetical protein